MYRLFAFYALFDYNTSFNQTALVLVRNISVGLPAGGGSGGRPGGSTISLRGCYWRGTVGRGGGGGDGSGSVPPLPPTCTLDIWTLCRPRTASPSTLSLPSHTYTTTHSVHYALPPHTKYILLPPPLTQCILLPPPHTCSTLCSPRTGVHASSTGSHVPRASQPPPGWGVTTSGLTASP